MEYVDVIVLHVVQNKIPNIIKKHKEARKPTQKPQSPSPTETIDMAGGRESIPTHVLPVLPAQRSRAILAATLEDYVCFSYTYHIWSADITDGQKAMDQSHVSDIPPLVSKQRFPWMGI